MARQLCGDMTHRGPCPRTGTACSSAHSIAYHCITLKPQRVYGTVGLSACCRCWGFRFRSCAGMLPLHLEVQSSDTREAAPSWYCEIRLIHRILRMIAKKTRVRGTLRTWWLVHPWTGKTPLRTQSPECQNHVQHDAAITMKLRMLGGNLEH